MDDAGLDGDGRRRHQPGGPTPGRTDRWLATGSHLDTVVDGGSLDGAYGVVAGVEVAPVLRDAGRRSRHGLLVVAFANEEGARGTDGMTGSHAVVGAVDADELAPARRRRRAPWPSGSPTPVVIPPASPPRRWPLAQIDAFVELHIEQGPVLDAAGHVLGVGARDHRAPGRSTSASRGRPNHAGTHADGPAPRRARRRRRGRARGRGAGTPAARCGSRPVATSRSQPNVRNVVPGTAVVSVELRDEDTAASRRRSRELGARLGADRRPRGGVTVDGAPRPARASRWPRPTRSYGRSRPSPPRAASGWSALPSGAGHDAQILGPARAGRHDLRAVASAASATRPTSTPPPSTSSPAPRSCSTPSSTSTEPTWTRTPSRPRSPRGRRPVDARSTRATSSATGRTRPIPGGRAARAIAVSFVLNVRGGRREHRARTATPRRRRSSRRSSAPRRSPTAT